MATGRFNGKHVLVTGAASGIARAAAERLAQEGASLTLADRDQAAARAVAEDLAARYGGSASSVWFEASDTESCRAMVEKAVQPQGRLDALLNIAGVYSRGRFEDVDIVQWRRVLDVNLTSLLPIIQAALPHLARTGGSIVNTASIAGLRGIAYAAPYAAAKAGVVALSQSLAAEFGPLGVRVNVVCPGGVNTAMTANLDAIRDPDPSILFPKPKLLGKRERAEPEDLAGAYAFLASDDARFTSGSVIVVDGAQMVG